MIHEGGYKPNNFTPTVLAMDLSDYVFQITDNAKKFPEYTETAKRNDDGTYTKIMIMRQDSLINKVREQAYQIYILAFTANEINVGRQPDRKAERLSKQAKAIELCNEHLATIQLCRKKFHLSNKRIKYWGRLTLNVRSALERWNESDRDRYKRI